MPREPLLLDGDRVLAIGSQPQPASNPDTERDTLVATLRSVERWLAVEAPYQADATRSELRVLVRGALARADAART